MTGSPRQAWRMLSRRRLGAFVARRRSGALLALLALLAAAGAATVSLAQPRRGPARATPRRFSAQPTRGPARTVGRISAPSSLVAGTGHPGLDRARSAGCGGRPPREHLITTRRWLSGVIVTEYYPAPERWFSGREVPTPGMAGRHHVDWLYSAHGLSMQGDGIDRFGRLAHIVALGDVGWVNAAGVPTAPPHCGIRWSHGPPQWRAGGWRNGAGEVTFPLQSGGWSHGRGHWVGDYGGATFASGPSLPVRFYHSVAVDPRLIPEGSRIYIPDYRALNGGWFVAQDTGGAIIGRHIDVYRPPTAQPFGSGRLLLAARVYVIPPGA